jgi:hypothetical protein
MLRRIFVLLVLAILATNVSATSQIRRGKSCRTGQTVIKPKFEPGLSFLRDLPSSGKTINRAISILLAQLCRPS